MYPFAILLMAQARSPSLHSRTRAFLAAAWKNSRASEHPTVGPVIEVVDWEGVGNDDLVVLEQQLKNLLGRIGKRRNYSTREFKAIVSEFNESLPSLVLIRPHLRVLEDAPRGVHWLDRRLFISLERVHGLALADSEKQSFQILIQALEGVSLSPPSGRPLEYQLQVAEIRERNRRRSGRTRGTGETSEEHHSEPSQARTEPIYATVREERTPANITTATYANAPSSGRRRSLPDPPREQVLNHSANPFRPTQRAPSPSSWEFDDFPSGSDLNLSDTEARVFSPARVLSAQGRERRKSPRTRHRRPTTPQRSPSPRHPWRDRRRPHRSPSPRRRTRTPPSPTPSPGSSPSPPPSPRHRRRRPSGMPPPPQFFFPS